MTEDKRLIGRITIAVAMLALVVGLLQIKPENSILNSEMTGLLSILMALSFDGFIIYLLFAGASHMHYGKDDKQTEKLTKIFDDVSNIIYNITIFITVIAITAYFLLILGLKAIEILNKNGLLDNRIATTIFATLLLFSFLLLIFIFNFSKIDFLKKQWKEFIADVNEMTSIKKIGVRLMILFVVALIISITMIASQETNTPLLNFTQGKTIFEHIDELNERSNETFNSDATSWSKQLKKLK